ncbi:MAG: catalase [Lachnospiraceae bacterium]|nr:catalase [Lachnospiraceae bacterium]MBR0152241.1 catalase [Lachnospiraceae bacterium]
MFHPIQHFKTITTHRHIVMRECFRVGLYRQGLLHDLSKYSPQEFLVGARYYQGNRSPNNAEREDIGVSLAWLHHKGRNKHHYEYWTDYQKRPDGTVGIEFVRMPVNYVVEMCMDRIAASMVYNGASYTNRDALNYYLKGNPSRYMHPDTAALLEKLLTILADQGEEALYAYIRGTVLPEWRRSRKK